MDYRSWGNTRNCKGCRYWSEMLAQSTGNGLQAMCISNGPNRMKYMSQHRTCAAWEEGSLGAVDEPGGNPYEQLGEV